MKFDTATTASLRPAWWKEAVVYQIYPRSFNDSNGDGIGDLKGITEKLDYLKELGINVIWLSPHFDSPNADNGYDIRDYRKVMQEFGHMADFDTLLAEIKNRGMRLIIDLVVNHTSDEHAWFVESRANKNNPKRDYYIWRDGNGDNPPNNYTAFFGGSAWEKDPQTGQYYLHYFASKQPDLNWSNPKVREEVYDIMRFWLDKGVSGFRMDVIPFIAKPEGLPDLPPELLTHPENVYANSAHLHQYLQEMNQKVLSQYDTMTVGEAFGVNENQARTLTDYRQKELNMIFYFDLVRMDRDNWRKLDWTLPQLRQVYQRLDDLTGNNGWNTTFLGNHDNPRAVSHFGDDRPQWREASAKALATMSLMQRATPFIYQGEELGMTNYPFSKLDDYDDVEVKGLWQSEVVTGKVSGDELLDNLRQTSRDNARTPFQWNGSSNGGFSTAKPWLAVNPNYTAINAEDQVKRPDSVYHYYRQLIEVRRHTPALVYGAYRDIDPTNEDVYAFTRTLEGEKYLIAVNFRAQPVHYALPGSLHVKREVLTTQEENDTMASAGQLNLQPWQAGIWQLA